MQEIDVVIVGQGLAGTALAWQLRWRGCRILVLDREPPVTSSRIAAGLITPVTGLRLAPTWRFADLWPAALAHYRRVERETGVPCYRGRRCVRLFQSEAERSLFERKADSALRGLVARLDSPIRSACFDAPLGGFEMPNAGQLLTVPYLEATREALAKEKSYLVHNLDPAREFVVEKSRIWLSSLNVSAGTVVFCQGHAGASNPWFSSIRFHSARGDILTLRVPGYTEARILNRGVWITPAENGLYRAGSTFDRTELADVPSATGREEICSRLREFLRLPFEVIAHHAAVRPIIDARKPLLGFHSTHPRIGLFNGLGSKGALVAPFFAAQLAEAITDGTPLDPDVDLRLSPSSGRGH